MHRQWTPEQRKQQSIKIREWKPWTKSTGARTLEGKHISSRNAFKGGLRQGLRELMRMIKQLVKDNKELKKKGLL